MFAVLLLLVNGCERDAIDVEDTIAIFSAPSGFSVNTVTAKEISKITGFLAAEHINLLQKDTIAGAVFDTNNIVEVMDTLSAANYSLRFWYPDTPDLAIHTCVLTRKIHSI